MLNNVVTDSEMPVFLYIGSIGTRHDPSFVKGAPRVFMRQSPFDKV